MDLIRFGHPLIRRRAATRQACCVAVALLVAVMLPAGAGAVPVTFQASGANAAAIQGTVDAFRAALGDPNNGNSPGPLGTGRREINWDGGGSTANAVAGTPFNGFQNIRGALFDTPAPGSGFIQAPPSGLATQFTNPTYADFLTFSDPRLFTPIGSTLTNVSFFVPGTNGATGATTTGFGVVFSDVDSSANASLNFLNAAGDSLTPNPFFVPAANGGLSFLGVIFPDQLISRVDIVSGNVPLGGATDGAGIDLIVMDDFLYREPAAVPEPATLFLLGTAMGGIALAARRRRARQP